MTTSSGKRTAPPDPAEEVAALVRELNAASSSARFCVDRDGGQVVVRVVDARTQEVVRRIPPGEIFQIRRHLGEQLGRLEEPWA